MNLFFSISTFFGSLGYLVIETVLDFRDWLKINDFSGTQRRKRYLNEAPESFAADHLPVVLDANDTVTFRYHEQGFVLKHRITGKTAPITRRSLRRWTRRGIKSLRRESAKLTMK